MKLLFDQNFSPELAIHVPGTFAGSKHLQDLEVIRQISRFTVFGKEPFFPKENGSFATECAVKNRQRQKILEF